MTKIGIVVSTFPPYAGGMGNVAAAQAKALVERGFAVTVYTPAVERSGSGNTVQVPGVSVVAVPATVRFGNAAWLSDIVARVVNDDIIMLHYPFFGAAHSFAKGLPANKHLVVYYHMDTVAKGWRRIVFNWYHRCLPGLLAHASLVLVSSRDYAAHSRLAAFVTRLNNRLQVVPLSVDTERFSPSRKSEELLRRYQLTSETPVVLFVGGLDAAHYFKGVRPLLSAWKNVSKAIPNARLLIVGEGNRQSVYKAWAGELGIIKTVGFLGHVSEAELPEHYRLADIVVSPSIDSSEAFGLVLLEAMACGKATVASDLPGVRSVVVDGETGHLVPPNDSTQLAVAITDLLQRPAVCQRYGERGRDRVITNYATAVVGDRLAELLRNVA